MAEELNVFDAIGKLGVAGRPLGQNEVRIVGRVAEAAKQVIDESARQLIRNAHKRPVLFQYQGDGTPLKLKHSFQVAFAEHHVHARSGYTGVELYCQGGFLRSYGKDGEVVLAPLLRDPRPMSGKGALNAFNGLIEFFPPLDQLDHDGFNLHHYSWDRALFSACRTLSRKYHTAVLRKIVDSSPRHTGTMKVLKSWLLCTGCGLHDVHNAFSWGISKVLVQSSDMLDQMYIVLESLRNGFKHLQSHLASFLMQHVVFEDMDVAQSDLLAFWTALDITPDLSSMLAERGVFWKDGKLLVSCACKDDPDIIPWLYNALMTVFCFKRFSTSRWITVGSSMRTLIAACALGIRHLHQVTIEDPHVGTYYLSGFKNLSGPMRHMAVVAALSSRPTEALSLAMLEDDRAVRNIDNLEGILTEEMNWLQQLSLPVWQLLSLASDSGSSCRAIRSECLDCAHTSVSYTYKNFLSQVRSLPWSLAIGDVSANLDAFAGSSEPVEDAVAKKIKTLLSMKFSRTELEEAVLMLRECRWSTAFAEQLHAQCAVLHKLHREYGAETLCARTMLQLAKLLTGADPLAMEEQKAKKKLTLLRKKQPERASGRSHFVGAFVADAKQSLAPQRTLAQHETQEIWTAGSQRWSALEPSQKRAFSATATSQNNAKRARLEEEKGKVSSDLSLTLQRAAEERARDGVQSRLSSCRLTDAQRQRLQEICTNIGNVQALRKLAMMCLETPAKRLQEEMDSVQLPAGPTHPVAQEWVKRLTTHRDLLPGSILCIAGPSRKRFYYYMYAVKSPQEVILSPLKVRPIASEALGSSSSAMDMQFAVPCASGSFSYAVDLPIAAHCESFHLSLGDYISGRALTFADDEYVFVVPHVGFGLEPGEVVGNSRDAVYYVDYLKGQPKPQAQTENKGGHRSKRQEDLLKANPWLGAALAKKRLAKPAEDDPPDEDEDVTLEMTEDVVSQVMARLAASRSEFQELHAGEPHDFEVYLRREYAHRSSEICQPDCARGEALASAESFCRAHSLNMSSTFAFARCGGEVGGNRLAQEWCRRMQFLFDAHKTRALPVDWPAVSAEFPLDDGFEKWVLNCGDRMVEKRAAQISAIMPV